MGRLTGTSTQYAFLTGTFSNSYSYDGNSNRTGFTAPDGSTNTYSYDTLNRLSTLANSWAGSFGFTYDALSRRTQMTRPNNVATNYGYDNQSRLLSVLHQLSGGTIDGATYTVDSAGNRTSKTDNRANVTSNYGYDAIYELLQTTQGGTTTESYTYDPVGNRLSSLGVSPYSNNSSNELSSTPNASYTYDNNGNMLTKTASGSTTNYTWDYENRLTQLTLPGTGGTVTFKYDPLGRRIQKAFTQGSTTTTTNYLYEGNNSVQDVDQNGNLLARYAATTSTDEPLAQSSSGVTSYFDADGLGSVTSLSNPSGSLVNTYTYDSFGKLTNSSGSISNRFEYTAREFDSESGLYYYRARYYDPTTGKFLSEDPWDADPTYDRPNLYEYVRNTPVNLVDPLGLYKVKPGVPAPSPALGKLLDCMDLCLGIRILVTATTPQRGERHQDPGHAAGTSVDIHPPAGIPTDKVFCCAGRCGAAFGVDEGPNGIKAKYTTAANYHIQLVPPHHPSPKAPNAIPNRSDCKDIGCKHAGDSALSNGII